jgi:protoporphyrin/coproporphyrin ferrochelatase
MRNSYDAVLLIAFGGPTAPHEVRPFLDNVVRGRRIPAERLEVVADHYERIGGRSPLNELTVRQARALETELRAAGAALPVYVGMRNWTPYLHETLQRMAEHGVCNALGVIMSAHQTEASWGRYQRDVATARERVGAPAPQIDYVDEWHAHPLFIAAVSDNAATASARIPAARREAAALVFTAHSVPVAMAEASPYVAQIEESSRLVAQSIGRSDWSIAYQSRSGSPHEPWLGPDIGEAIGDLARRGARDLVVVPIGFVCDHVEVLYDLDIEARQVADAAGVNMTRAATVNDHPIFIRMLADVVRRKTLQVPSPVPGRGPG